MSNTRSNIFDFNSREKMYILSLIKDNTEESIIKLISFYVNNIRLKYSVYRECLDEPDEGLLFISKSGYSLVVNNDDGIEGLVSKETNKFVPINDIEVDTSDIEINENVFEWLEYVKDNK